MSTEDLVIAAANAATKAAEAALMSSRNHVDVMQSFAQIERQLAVHEKGHEADTAKINELRAAFFGNGTPGVKATVAGLKEKCDAGHCATPWSSLFFNVLGQVLTALIIGLAAWFIFADRILAAPGKH